MLPENELALLVKEVSRKSCPRGTTIISAGDVTESLYVVISGRLKVMVGDDEGREMILTFLGPNEFFGEMSLIDDHPRSASVVALEACECLTLAKRDFKRCLEENFEMAMTVMRGLVKRLREADQKISSLALMDVYGPYAVPSMSVPDLTTLSKRSNGVFPVQHVYDVIDGTEILRAHGTRDMPIWGTIYRSQIEERRFDIPPYAPEAYVQARILALIDYISRLQVK
jgi:CRP/FNR family cyclic AMP-dependent transcriptional regulator